LHYIFYILTVKEINYYNQYYITLKSLSLQQIRIIIVLHNYVLIEHNYSQFVIYNFKSELKFWKNYNVVKIIIIMIVISGIILN